MRYKLFGNHTGLRVSEFALGTGNFGTGWGPKTVEQLRDNLAVASLVLTAEHIDRLDKVSAIPLGAPHELLTNARTRQRLTGGKLDLLDLPSAPLI
jgi:aryl-alcohol dehydrogenase-like predicted oxidoreductase